MTSLLLLPASPAFRILALCQVVYHAAIELLRSRGGAQAPLFLPPHFNGQEAAPGQHHAAHCGASPARRDRPPEPLLQHRGCSAPAPALPAEHHAAGASPAPPGLTPMSRSHVGFHGAEDGTLPSPVTKLSAQHLRKRPLQKPDLLVAVNTQQVDGGSRTKPSPPAPTSAGFYPTTGLGVRVARTSHADVRRKTTWHRQLAQLLRARPVQDHKSAP